MEAKDKILNSLKDIQTVLLDDYDGRIIPVDKGREIMKHIVAIIKILQ